ncbi:MAG: hypothetical protein JWO80_743 [Bryobacterales bacterium]|jgi:hypothetical protein|nr:hypothetical protein [Bryobacterales bacterium]
MSTKFIAAMIVYAVLAVVAAFWIEGTLRIAVWILLGGLALKTLIAKKAGW